MNIKGCLAFTDCSCQTTQEIGQAEILKKHISLVQSNGSEQLKNNSSNIFTVLRYY